MWLRSRATWTGTLIGHGGGRGAGARGVGEDVEVGEGQVGDEAAGGVEFGVGFAGESDHNVGADSGGGHGGANLLDLLAIVPGTILAMHAAQHGIAAGLQWHVRMLGDPRRRGHQRDEFVGPIHGLDGGDAEFFEPGFRKDSADERFEIRASD